MTAGEGGEVAAEPPEPSQVTTVEQTLIDLDQPEDGGELGREVLEVIRGTNDETLGKDSHLVHRCGPVLPRIWTRLDIALPASRATPQASQLLGKVARIHLAVSPHAASPSTRPTTE